MKYIDVNGDSIWFTIDEDVVTMHFTTKVINKSSDNINMNSAANSITSDITNTFSGNITIDDKKYTFKLNAQISSASSMDDVSDSDHLFIISTTTNFARGSTSMLGGKAMHVSRDDFHNDNWFSNTFFSNNTRTSTHEFGHALGLTHESAINGAESSNYDPTNIMTQTGKGGTGNSLFSTQLNSIYTNWKNGKLNQWTNYQYINGVKHPNNGIYDPTENKVSHINKLGIYYK